MRYAGASELAFQLTASLGSIIMKAMNTFKECFDAILRGNKENSRLAARRVRKLLYSGERFGKDKFIEIKNLIQDAPVEYAKIPEDWRQENFVLAVSVIYYLHDREDQPDFLFPWLFELLQHEDGNIRHAAVKMFSIEIGPLTVHIRFPEDTSILGDRLKPAQADAILLSLFVGLHEHMAAAWKPAYKKYKYISSLPSNPYKSGQLILARFEELCGRSWVERFIEQSHSRVFNPSSDAFLTRVAG